MCWEQAVIANIIAMAGKLDRKIIAEGVKTGGVSGASPIGRMPCGIGLCFCKKTMALQEFDALDAQYRKKGF